MKTATRGHGGIKKAAAARGKVFAAGRNDKKNDKKIER